MEKPAKIPSRDSKTVRKLLKMGALLMMAPAEQNGPKRRIFLAFLMLAITLTSVYCIWARCDVMIQHDLPEILILMTCVTAISGESHCISQIALN